MKSPEFDRILSELNAHPREREGFRASDLDALQADERKIVKDLLFERVEEGGDLYVPTLKLLLRDDYLSELKLRLSAIPSDSHGQVYLPILIFELVHAAEYLIHSMLAVINSAPEWKSRDLAVYRLLKVSGGSDLFKDFCHYLVLHDPSPEMRERALRALLDALNINADNVHVPRQYRNILTAETDLLSKLTSTKALLNKVYEPRKDSPFEQLSDRNS